MDSLLPISYDPDESSRAFRYFGLTTPGFWKGSILTVAKELRGSEEDTRADVRPAIKAAEYVRMSTEHQKYSTENQGEAIRAYATTHGMKIVRTYADAGKSGLSIKGRDALQSLIEDVETGVADFEVILVYNISRWGRFQDADESAYYEYICRRANIQVQYCPVSFLCSSRMTAAPSPPSSRA